MSGINFNYLLKYIIIGDSGVGKSNILLRYIHEKFTDEFNTTIGVEFGAKNIQISDKIYRIQIWDTAGQENFRSITRAYYKNSICACVVYDITKKSSFDNVKSWVEDCKKQCPKSTFFVLIGNKSDLVDQRKISYEEGEKFAVKYNMLFYETSAKNGDNINDVFLKSAQKIGGNIENGVYDLSNDICGIKVGSSSKIISLKSSDNNKDVQENNNDCC